ncbi:MAG: porin, partial [Pseudomonadota bacterium]
MKISKIPFALPLLVLSSGAVAQGLEYQSYGASYTNLSVDGDDVDFTNLSAGIDYRTGNVIVSGGFGYTDLDGDVDITTLGLRAGYFVVPNAVVYAGVNTFKVEDDSATSYNVGGEYMTNGLTFGLNYEDLNEDNTDPITTAYVGYAVSPTLEFGLAIADDGDDTVTTVGLDYDAGGTDFAAIYTESDGVSLLALDGHYDFGNRFRAGGGYIDIDGDGDLLTVSGGYELT